MLKIADNLSLPLDAVTSTFAVLAKRRVGKSYLAAVMAEEMLAANQPVVIIDPTGAHWGLRSSSDGKKPGYPIVVLGGDHADLPLEEHAGEVVAQSIVEHRFPAILDLSHFRKGQASRFMAAFLETFYRLNREAVHLIVDEADTFAPQRVMGEEARVCGAMEDVVKKGGIRGIGVTLITQRPAVLNKNVLTQCESLFVLRMTHPKDIDAIREWVGVHAEPDDLEHITDLLPSMEVGDAWFWSPGWIKMMKPITVRRRRTFDSGATPKPGETRKAPKQLASIDLAKLGEKMKASVESAKANDPKELRRQIGELQKQLATKPKAQADAAAIDKAVFVALERRDREWIKTVKERDDVIDMLRVRMTNAAGLLHINGEATPKIGAPEKSLTSPVKTTVYQPRQENQPVGGLSRMERSFLTVLAQHPDGLTKRQILTHTDYASSGPVSTLFAKMVRDAWVDEPASSSLRITPAGLTALGPFEPLPKGAELRELRLSSPKLSPMEKAILGCLFGNYPNGITKREILGATGYKSSGPVSTTFAKFVRLGWAQQHGRSALKAADVFFE